MPAPTEHKTVQARILKYAQEIGWTYVPRPEAEQRRGFDPAAATPEEWARKPDLENYVIVHELLHFSVPNHGKLWKSLMRAHLGEYEQLEARMKHAAGRRARYA